MVTVKGLSVPTTQEDFKTTDPEAVNDALANLLAISARNFGEPVVYTASGAIAEKEGLSVITKAGVGVMTLADPVTADNGKRLCILSTTAQAHTITTIAHFNGDTNNTATFSAAKGNNLVLRAQSGYWFVESSVGASFSHV